MSKSGHTEWISASLRVLLAVVLTVTAALILYFRVHKEEEYVVHTVAPTCSDNGYSLYTHVRTGQVYVEDIVPAQGHRFEKTQTVREENGYNPVLLVRICGVCGTEEQQAVYPSLSVPRLSLYGSLDGIGKTQEVSAEVEYLDTSRSFRGYAALKYQGHSTLAFPKKNYTVKFYLDEDHNQKNKLSFSHWNPEHKYILKANYADSSHCRNVICANVWANMVQSRQNVPRHFSSLSNFGAVDGFPLAVYLNDEFHGLYTLTLHKDDDLFGMESGEEQAIMIANSAASPEAFFREKAAFTENSPWEVEFCGTEDSTWAKERLNGLIDFVMTSDDETFRRQLKNHLDVDSAIDYLIAMYALGLPAHGAKDLILVCYGQNDPWICSHFDMEEAFGLDSTEVFRPTQKNGKWDSATGSLLWDRVLNIFYPEICRRYVQLRKNALDAEDIATEIRAYIGQISPGIYRAEAETNGTDLFTADETEQMIKYLKNQIALLDTIFTEGRK